MSKKKGCKGKGYGRKKSHASKDLLLYRGNPPTEYEASSRHLSKDAADLIIVDESNSFSSKNDGVRKNLVIVCIRVKDRDSFLKIARLIPEMKGIRVKYSNSRMSDRMRILTEIAKYDVTVTERHRPVEYERLVSTESKKAFYVAIMNDALNSILDTDPLQEVDIILDSPPLVINEELTFICKRLMESGRRIRWFETAQSAANPYLKIHDYVTGIVSDHLESIGDDTLYKIIEIRVS